MKKLIEHLMPCAICGSAPKINDIYDKDPENTEHCYKLFCTGNGVHNSTGEWFASKYEACQDWNRRQQENEWENRKNRSVSVSDCTVEAAEALRKENQKLKQMLKKVADDAKGLFEECAEYSPYEECLANEYCQCCNSDCDGSQCKWRYEDDVKKLLKTKEK